MASELEIKGRPILFSGPMVRAILAGTKTQTRRVAKYPPYDPCDVGLDDQYLLGNIKCPYGEPGDRLWVREIYWEQKAPLVSGVNYFYGDTWKKVWPNNYNAQIGINYDADRRLSAGKHPVYGYEVCADGVMTGDPRQSGWKKKPSIHMPRWASRITLEIVSVRVERVQDISHEDALAEGCKGYNWVESSPYIVGPHTDNGELPAEEFASLWDSINAKRGFGWKENPWVWVVEFKRIMKEEPDGN